MLKLSDLKRRHAELTDENSPKVMAGLSSDDGLLERSLRMAISVMKHRGIETIHSIGNLVKFGVTLPTAGEKIIVAKGTPFSSLRDGHAHNIAEKDREIAIHSVSNEKATGFYEEYSDDPGSIQELAFEIKWAGIGGYWCTVTLNDWIEHGGYEKTLERDAKRKAAMDKKWKAICQKASDAAKGITVGYTTEDPDLEKHNGPCKFIEAITQTSEEFPDEFLLPIFILQAPDQTLIHAGDDEVDLSNEQLALIFQIFSIARNPEASGSGTWKGPQDLIRNAPEQIKKDFICAACEVAS